MWYGHMPLKLVPPRGKSPNWRIHGTHLGVRVNQSTWTADRRLAARVLAKVRSDIEAGALAPARGPTFAAAALRYLDSGGERRFILRLAEHFGETPLDKIDQAAVDAAAVALYPSASAATRNRQVYSPVSAILKRAGRIEPLRRPKGGQGVRRLAFLQPEQISRLLAAAEARDLEFALFLAFLVYTGCRLTEALAIDLANLNLGESWAYIPRTKNSEPRLVHLPRPLVTALIRHPRGFERQGRLFRFKKCGRLYTWLEAATTEAGVDIPRGVAYHILRHTWGAWMRRYGGLDTAGLIATGAWRSRAAASIYEHAVQSEEARRADLLPDVTVKLALDSSSSELKNSIKSTT
jgi:integrase